MERDTLEAVLAVVASAVFLFRLLPQPIRLARTGVAAGVSPLAALNALTVAVAWAAYGLSAQLPVVFWASVLATVPGVWTVLLLRRSVSARDLAWGSAWVAVLVAATFTGALGAVLALGVVVTQGPQVLEALRDDDLTGLAPATWWISLADAASWGAYGAVLGDGALLGYAAVLSTAAVVVLARIRWTRRAGTTRRAAELGPHPS